jgi:hypothetical protein
MLVKNHSESDLRVDPTNSQHLIGTSKWVVSAEGYNHELGFFESWDGGATWPVQGHIPGYEGWTDNTDPVGAFDRWGNFYTLILPYEFFYNSDGSHNFKTNQNVEPNPSVPAEAITVSVRKHGATSANDWSTARTPAQPNGKMDIVAPYPNKGREPDKQWITIDDNPTSPFHDTIYAMWTVFDSFSATPWVSTAKAYSDGTHGPWSAPQLLPTAGSNPQGDTYLLPHVDANGVVYTTLTNFEPNGGFCCSNILLDKSANGGATWSSSPIAVAQEISAPPPIYPNTNFRDGIEDTFAVGPKPDRITGQFPLYVAWEDHNAGFGNLILSASYDGGTSWSKPIQVNDNVSTSIDAVQPNLTTAPDGTVLVAFYDRRLACPTNATDPAGVVAAGMTLDPNFDPNNPVGLQNYCINASLQAYGRRLGPIGNNIRLSSLTWDPQLNSLKPSGIGATEGFIGDYFGVIASGTKVLTTSTSTATDGTNDSHFQQQVIASLTIP